MNVYGLNLWDDPDEYDEEEHMTTGFDTLSVDDITELWLAGKLDDETFDAWMDGVDPGWDESTALTKEELDELR